MVNIVEPSWNKANEKTIKITNRQSSSYQYSCKVVLTKQTKQNRLAKTLVKVDCPTWVLILRPLETRLELRKKIPENKKMIPINILTVTVWSLLKLPY
tara:strand:+ start:1424 stop:1717 length:294 start_codon:yes stop_codon:yes gene_type:complete